MALLMAANGRSQRQKQTAPPSPLRSNGWTTATPLFVYSGRSDRIRTYDPLIPNQMRYQAALRSEQSEILALLAAPGQSPRD